MIKQTKNPLKTIFLRFFIGLSFLLLTACGGDTTTALSEVPKVEDTTHSAPVAISGADIVVDEETKVILNGNNSYSRETKTYPTLTYLWSEEGTDQLDIKNSDTKDAYFIAPKVTEQQIFNVQLIVNDSQKSSFASVTRVTVNPVNTGPTVNAGSNQSVNQGTVVTLNATAADTDGGTVTLKWDTAEGVILTTGDEKSEVIKFTAPTVSQTTHYTFKLTVTDNEGASAVDEVSVTVTPINIDNLIPVAVAGDNIEVDEGTTVILNGNKSYDPEGTALTYSWAEKGSSLLSSFNTTSNSPIATFTVPNILVKTVFNLELIVSDGVNNSIADTLTVTANPVNTPPKVDAGINLFRVSGATGLSLTGTITDADSNIASTFEWTIPAGIELTNSTTEKSATLNFNAPINITETTHFTFTLTATDNEGAVSTDTVSLTVNPNNLVPVAVTRSTLSVNEGETVYLNGIESYDPENATITYAWSNITASAPTPTNPTHSVANFIAPAVMAKTTYLYQLIVNDGTDNSLPKTVEVTVNPVNQKPVANAGNNQSVVSGASDITLTSTASTDSDGTISSVEWTVPPGVTLKTGTKVSTDITFDVGTVYEPTAFTFNLLVTDNENLTDTDTVTVSVSPASRIPVAIVEQNKTVNEGDTVYLQGNNSYSPDGKLVTYAWSEISSVATGATLNNPTTSLANFTAPIVTTSTPYIFQLLVNDGTNTSFADTIQITVNPLNTKPVANAGPNQSVASGATGITLASTASTDVGGAISSVKWIVPNGITLVSSAKTDTAITFNAPTVSETTHYKFELIVTDNEGLTDNDFVTVSVSPGNKIPVAVVGNDITIDEGAVVTLTGSDSYDPESATITYLWSETSASGVTINDSTLAVANFTAPNVTTKTTFDFQLIVNDGTLNSISKTIHITVNPVNNNPIISHISNLSQNSGDTGIALTYIVTDEDKIISPASDNLAYKWSTPAGFSDALRTGGSFTSNTITITAPTVTELTHFTFTFSVTDTEGAVSTEQVTVSVSPISSNKIPVAVTGDNQIVEAGSTVYLNALESYDPDGTISTYAWSEIGSNTITLVNSASSVANFVAPNVDKQTVFSFQLIVNDGANNSFAATQTITVIPQQIEVVENNVASAETATATEHSKQVASNGGTAQIILNAGTIMASGVTVDTYSWTVLTGGGSINTSTIQGPTYTTAAKPSGQTASTQATIQLTIKFTDGSESSDVLILEANAFDDTDLTPQIQAGPDQTVASGSTVTLDGSASVDDDTADDDVAGAADADGAVSISTYAWSQVLGKTASLSATNVASPTFTAPYITQKHQLRFALTITDDSGQSTSDYVNILVTPN